MQVQRYYPANSWPNLLAGEFSQDLSNKVIALPNRDRSNFYKESFIKALGQQPVIQARFAQYLMGTPAAKKLKGGQFGAGQGLTIFDLFDLLKLQFQHREFMSLV